MNKYEIEKWALKNGCQFLELHSVIPGEIINNYMTIEQKGKLYLLYVPDGMDDQNE